jgi:hypothetical protein
VRYAVCEVLCVLGVMPCLNRELTADITKNPAELRADAVALRRIEFQNSLYDIAVVSYSGQQDLNVEQWGHELRWAYSRINAVELTVEAITDWQGSLTANATKFAENLLYTCDVSFKLPGMPQTLAALATR